LRIKKRRKTLEDEAEQKLRVLEIEAQRFRGKWASSSGRVMMGTPPSLRTPVSS